MAIFRPIDINTKYARAIFLILEGKDIFFGIAVRGLKNSKVDRWKFYIGINEEEYSFFVEYLRTHDEYSFLGIPSDLINIPKLLADVYMAESPGRFIGIHVDRDPWNADWADSSILRMIGNFYEQMRGTIPDAIKAKTSASVPRLNWSDGKLQTYLDEATL